MSDARELPDGDMERLAAQIRSVAQRLSSDQILDLADVLHEVIRQRQSSDRTRSLSEPDLASAH